MEEVKQEIIEEKVIRNEDDFLNRLSDISTVGEDFSLLEEGVKENIESKQKEIFDFIENNDPSNLDEKEKNEKFMELIQIWDELKNLIKLGSCNIEFTNLELKVMRDKLHKNVEYTSETIFYGLHLKKHFLNNLPKIKGDDFIQHVVPITFTQAVGLYHVLSETTVVGLSKETFAYANILYSLSLITQLYNYFDRVSAYTSRRMQEWNMAISETGTETDTEGVREIENLDATPGTPTMKIEK